MSRFHWQPNEILLVAGLAIAGMTLIAKRRSLGVGAVDFALLGAVAVALLIAIGEGVV